jgi:hypothetical protein
MDRAREKSNNERQMRNWFKRLRLSMIIHLPMRNICPVAAAPSFVMKELSLAHTRTGLNVIAALDCPTRFIGISEDRSEAGNS